MRPSPGLRPDLDRNKPIWTKGKFPSAAENLWEGHYVKHVAEFADIDNAVTYVEHALDFSSQTAQTQDLVIFTRVRGGLQEKVLCNRNTREFAIKMLDGPEQGALKTYFKVHPTKNIDDYINVNR
jgi:pyocin large subunit-like protein